MIGEYTGTIEYTELMDGRLRCTLYSTTPSVGGSGRIIGEGVGYSRRMAREAAIADATNALAAVHDAIAIDLARGAPINEPRLSG